MKRCLDCKIDKPFDQFYRRSKTSLAWLPYCRQCLFKRRAEWGEKNRDYLREYNRQRIAAMTPSQRTKFYRRRREAQPQEKLRARWLVRHAVLRGEIKRGACLACGDDRVEAHHPDYSKPLEVVWLCKRCHTAEHRKESNGRSAEAQQAP